MEGLIQGAAYFSEIYGTFAELEEYLSALILQLITATRMLTDFGGFREFSSSALH